MGLGGYMGGVGVQVGWVYGRGGYADGGHIPTPPNLIPPTTSRPQSTLYRPVVTSPGHIPWLPFTSHLHTFMVRRIDHIHEPMRLRIVAATRTAGGGVDGGE